eukprot:4960582-Pleurochrysis_carterae.AAC.1
MCDEDVEQFMSERDVESVHSSGEDNKSEPLDDRGVADKEVARGCDCFDEDDDSDDDRPRRSPPKKLWSKKE